ncbi:unnamed protein product (macronuclear) [Paramecium tetraurelia]|uniref:DC-UbP/UBTD2 N-terminal domain-containing protein n=1 Tax=Paramecium tetraurelia TaxID=5888 RepID=A0EIE7_PARTE|nr:uncharacterized protein GSPATT00027417001 [Paramecium tetraurelia]CAK95088.1 unnamed protein product [Paramecium tetraurelia]|eukprot:XP_001462461.1 hypothetical protein (macronuclear) [Paramecium tetraurelia strain d4-2]
MFTTPELYLDHPFNINRYQNIFFKYHPNVIIGEGFKRTYSYESLITEQQLLKKRNEYWETQIIGDQEVWIKLKQILDMDEESAKRHLEDANLTLVENSIQMVYDERGNRYQIPIFAINLPVSYSDSGIITLNNDFEAKDVTFKIRSVRWDQDQVATYNTKDSVEFLIQELKVKENVENVRLFIQGKEMTQQFGNYDITEESIVQAFLF